MPEGRCQSTEARQFDFWLGEWDLTWPAEQTGGEPGTTMNGTNRITSLFGPCVIEENFATADGRFKGRSLSVYDEPCGRWRQTWVDSSGSYIALTGSMEDDEMILTTESTEEDVVSRMVFTDITLDSLLWRWQKSTDGGQTWTDAWTITYRRR